MTAVDLVNAVTDAFVARFGKDTPIEVIRIYLDCNGAEGAYLDFIEAL